MKFHAVSPPILVLLLVQIFAAQANARFRTFLLAGQSNMVGYAQATGMPEPRPLPQVFVWNSIGSKAWSWSPLAPGFGIDSASFGPELTLGEALADAFPGDSIGFVKVAMGATTLEKDWHPPSAGGSGWLFDHMLNSLWWAAGQWPDGEMPAIEGVFWMQGESDATTNDGAENYQGLLTHLIQDVRANRADDSLPWVVGLIDRQPVWPFADRVRMAQRQVSWTLPGVGLVETRGLATDGVHYTMEGQLELGRRMARRWLVMQGYMPDTLAPIDRFDSVLVDTAQSVDSTGSDSALVDTTHSVDSTGSDSALVDTTHSVDSTGSDSALVDTTHSVDSTGSDSALVDTAHSVHSTGSDSALVDTAHSVDSTGRDSVLVDTAHSVDSTGRDSALVDTAHSVDSTGRDSALVDTTHAVDSTGRDSTAGSQITVSAEWRAVFEGMPPGTRIQVRDARGRIHARWIHGDSAVPPLLGAEPMLVVATLPNGRIEIHRRPPSWRR